jgi:3-deoxy-manno-octulosonate cytidylyltransferase (CMP-KDO synthetase)
MAIQKCVVAVPARLQSSRLPNKVLADIGGKPMIQRVLERCRESTEVDTVVLCTDSQELQQRAAVWGFPVLMTAESCSSGSDRIASVADALMALAWGDATPAQSKPL